MAKIIMWRIWSAIASAFAIATTTPAYGKDVSVQTPVKVTQTLCLKKSERPSLFLQKRSSDHGIYLAGHRSHRSHSSHRSGSGSYTKPSHASHSAHYSGSYTVPDKQEDTVPDKRKDTVPDKQEDTVLDKRKDTIPDKQKDTIYLVIFKDGKKITSELVWEEDNQVKVFLYGGVIGYPKEKIEKIELIKQNNSSGE